MSTYDNLIDHFYRGETLVNDNLQGYTTASTGISTELSPDWLIKKKEKQARLDNKLQTLINKGALLDGWDDGDSSKYLRVKGIDTPETFHDLDLHSEKTKMAKQYMLLNPDVSPQEAYATVEGQYDAFKIAQEQGQDLSQLITDYRAQGLIEDDFGPTAFDINQAGVNASNYAREYDQANINDNTTGFSASQNLLTGETGYYDRYLVDDKKYTDSSISQGYAAPGSTDKATYAQQLQATANAKNKKLGNYATATGAKIMDAIIASSATKKMNADNPTMKSTGDMLHYETPEELQYQVGSRISEGAVTRDPGTGKFYERIDGKDVEVHPDDVSAMYIAKNKTGESTKLGIARIDVTQELWDKYGDMAPMVARYMNKDPEKGGVKAYIGNGGDYDGTPGASGIDVNDPNAAVIFMKKKEVKALEKYVHTHAGQVEARTAGSDELLPKNKHEKLEKQFGAGTSEYTLSTGENAAPLFNVDYDMDRVDNITDALKAEPMPSTDPQWRQVKAMQNLDPEASIRAEDISTASKYKPRSVASILADADVQEDGFWAEAKSFPGAAVHGATKGVGNLIDFAGELVQRGSNAIFDTEYSGGAFEDGTVEKFSNSLGKALGYDHRDDAKVNAKAQKFYDKATKGVELLDVTSWGNLGVMDVLRGMGTQLTNPSSAVSSLGELGGTGGSGKVATVLGKAGMNKLRSVAAKEAAQSAENVFKKIASVKADKALTKVEKKAALKQLNGQVTTIQKTSKMLQDAIPAIAYSMDITNQHMEEYRKNNNNEDMSNGRMFGTLLANTLAFAMPEIATTKIALGMNSVVNDKLKEKVKGGVLQAVARLGAGGLAELPQETVEAIVETINTKWGTEKYKDKTIHEIVNEATSDIIGQGFGGLVGGVHMASPRAASSLVGANSIGGAISGTINKLKPKVTKVKDQVKAAQEKFSNIKTDDIAAAGASIHQMGKDTVDGVKEAFKGTKEAGAAYIVTNPDSPAATFTAVDEADDKYNNDDVKAAAAEFDEEYGKLTEILNNTLQEAKVMVDEAKETTGEDHDLGPHIAVQLVAAIEPLKVTIQQAKDAGAGPQRIAHMEATVRKLEGVAQVQSQHEMASIMATDIDAKSRASVILGSSDEAFKSEDGTVDVAVIDTAINDKDITPVQKKLLEYKKNVIQNATNPKSKAAMEKVYGSGSKRGLLDYANELVGGALTSTSMERLEKFAQSQVDKLQMYQEAVNDWKEANPDKSPAYEDKTTLSNGTEYSVNGAKSVVDAITTEQVYIDELLSLAKNPNASQKASTEPVTDQTITTNTNTQETIAEPSKVPSMSQEEAAEQLKGIPAKRKSLQTSVQSGEITAEEAAGIFAELDTQEKELNTVISQVLSPDTIVEQVTPKNELTTYTTADYQSMSDEEFTNAGKNLVEAGLAAPKGSKERKELQTAYKAYSAVGKAQNREVYTPTTPKVVSVDPDVLAEATQIIKEAGLDGEVGSESFNKAVETKVVELNQQKTKDYNDTVTKIANDIYASIGTANQISTDSIIADPKNPNYEFVASNKEAVKKKVAELIGSDTPSDPYTFTDKEISNMTSEQVDAELNAMESVDTLSDTQINTRDRLRAAYEQKVSEQESELVKETSTTKGVIKEDTTVADPVIADPKDTDNIDVAAVAKASIEATDEFNRQFEGYYDRGIDNKPTINEEITTAAEADKLDEGIEAEFKTLQQEIESIDPQYDMSDIIGPVTGPESKSIQERIDSAKEVLKEISPSDKTAILTADKAMQEASSDTGSTLEELFNSFESTEAQEVVESIKKEACKNKGAN